MNTEILHKTVTLYQRFLRGLVLGLAIVSGMGIVAMMVTTCADVVLRALNHGFTGGYDVVRLLSVITIACALPYTTAVKGHVAVEYFFHKLPGWGRVVVDSAVRVILLGLFGVLAVQNVQYGIRLHTNGTVTSTLQIPVFWVPYVIAFSCLVVVLVVLNNLIHPGKVMIKP